MLRPWLIGGVLLAGLLGLAGCGPLLGGNDMPDDLAQVTLQVGTQTLTVDLADTPASRTQGLSGRESLTDQQGMLFVYDAPLVPSFWMKDMNFPLDMLWIAEGVIVDATENVPLSEPPLPTYSPNQPVEWILEVNAGWMERHGVELGDRVSIVEGW